MNGKDVVNFNLLCLVFVHHAGYQCPGSGSFWNSRIGIRNYLNGFEPGSFHQEAQIFLENLEFCSFVTSLKVCHLGAIAATMKWGGGRGRAD
jgi:hypothetical protein